MSAFRITMLANGVTSKPSVVSSSHVCDELFQLGLEYKTADVFHDKTVVLIIEPHEPDPQARIAELEATIDRIRGEVER